MNPEPLRDRDSHDNPAREQAARELHARNHPGAAWADEPESVRMAWRAAVTEKHYPRTCTECGHTGDTHPPTSFGGHRFTTKEAS